jgi:hypothetical protein
VGINILPAKGSLPLGSGLIFEPSEGYFLLSRGGRVLRPEN